MPSNDGEPSVSVPAGLFLRTHEVVVDTVNENNKLRQYVTRLEGVVNAQAQRIAELERAANGSEAEGEETLPVSPEEGEGEAEAPDETPVLGD